MAIKVWGTNREKIARERLQTVTKTWQQQVGPDADNLFEYLTTQHSNTEFTFDKQVNDLI